MARRLALGLALLLAAGCSAGSAAKPTCKAAPAEVLDFLNSGANAGATISTAFIEDGGPYDPGFGEGYTSFSYVAATVKGDVAVWAVTYQGTEIGLVLPMNDHARGVNIIGIDASPGAPVYKGIGGEGDEAYGRAVACAETG